MIRILASGMVMLGMVSLPSGISPVQTPIPPSPDYRNDPRLTTLSKFFHKLECPAEQYSAVFLEAADKYALDWRLLPSLSFIETTGGKSARNNNFFGWDSGRAQFPSPAAAIREVGYRLKYSSLYINKRLDKLLAVYNPDAEYGHKVKSVMRRISPTE